MYEDTLNQTTHSCPECAEVGGFSYMSLEDSAIKGDTITAQLKCWSCGYKDEFNSADVDPEYGDDGWKLVEHGTLWPNIKATRKARATEKFWKAYRDWRLLFRTDPQKYTAQHNWRAMQRRTTDWAVQEMLKQASPMTLLDKYANT